MHKSRYVNPINFCLILLLCCFTYTVTAPSIVSAKTEEKQKRNEEKQERREEKRQRQEEKQAEKDSKEERDKDQDRRIQQLESDSSQSGILGMIDSATGPIPVAGPIVDGITDFIGIFVPSKYCENNCGVGGLPRTDSHAWTCKDKGHDSPVVVWMCYEATVECPKTSEHFNCAGQNAHNRNRTPGSDGNRNPDCTICWGSGACHVCDNIE